MSLVWFLAGVVLLVLSLALAHRPLPGTVWLLLRSVLPTWRFFEDAPPGAELWHRTVREGGEAGEPWQPTIVFPARGFLSLLYNPEGNLALAEQSLVEHLLSDLDGCRASEVEALASYQLTQRLVEQRLRSSRAPLARRYQFQLRADGEELFASEWHSL